MYGIWIVSETVSLHVIYSNTNISIQFYCLPWHHSDLSIPLKTTFDVRTGGFVFCSSCTSVVDAEAATLKTSPTSLELRFITGNVRTEVNPAMMNKTAHDIIKNRRGLFLMLKTLFCIEGIGEGGGVINL